MTDYLLSHVELRLADYLGGAAWTTAVAKLLVVTLLTLLIFALWKIIDRWRKSLHSWIDAEGSGARALMIQDQQVLSERELARFSHVAINYGWVAVRIALVLVWINLVLTQFAWTQRAAFAVIDMTLVALGHVFGAILNYLPDLAIIIVIVMVSRLVLRVTHAIFEGIRLERITIPGFYPDWARTSYGLVRLLIIALTLVIAFPYFPGSSSPAFQGLSIFFGVLVSLGSTSAVANVVAGIVITYTRAFKVGDRVRIADTEGDIVERSAFVTRIRTPKNEDVAVPNSMVMNNFIVNHSAQARATGLLLHTTVTIGYEVSWKRVHELLIEAAQATECVLDEPAPFVLQTSLDDNYVAYELNAYIREVSKKATIMSDMHANIQDAFSAANIEILSPSYRVHRAGSEQILPAEGSW